MAERLGRELVMGGMRLGFAHTLAISNWAVVELRRGQPRQAIELFHRVLDSGRLRGRTGRLLEGWGVSAGPPLGSRPAANAARPWARARPLTLYG